MSLTQVVSKALFGWLCILLISGQCFSAPNKVSSGEEVLVVTTISPDDGVEFVPTSPVPDSGSAESWERDDTGPKSIAETEMPVLADAPKPSSQDKIIKPEIYSFRVKSDIKYRYSNTLITSRVANRDSSRAQEVSFTVILPDTAFISKFLMEIDGTVYKAYVKEKEEAKRVYTQAQSLGQTAGLVEVSSRNSNTFNVNVNIKAQSKVTFNLTYEELLSRRLGRYEQVINISPEQVTSVKDFKILVNIEESQNITLLRVPNLRNDIDTELYTEDNEAAVLNKTGKTASVSWSPSVKEQEMLSQQGTAGRFVVQYDIERESTSGEVLVMEGYFVHFFSPEKLKPLRKHVVFVLDVSGSMDGAKMRQLKESQKRILSDLNPDDYFNIITFSSNVEVWTPDTALRASESDDYGPFRSEPTFTRFSTKAHQPFQATEANVEKAKRYIGSLQAEGGTNIHDAVTDAISLIASIKKKRDVVSSVDAPETELPESNEGLDSKFVSPPDERPTEIPTTMRSVSIRDSTTLPKNVESLIMFLTDGEPTVGETEPFRIMKLIRNANKNLSIPIFSLGFGEGADFPFLRKLSLQNNGFARKIYEDSDAALQLKGFYREIASPLLANVVFNYTSPEYNITDLTVTSFPNVFGGSEIAVAGQLLALLNAPEFDISGSDVETTEAATTISPNPSTISSQTSASPEKGLTLVPADKNILNVGISGNGRDGLVEFKPPVIFCGNSFDKVIRPPFPPRPTPPPSEEDAFLERLWAYLTIKQLVDEDIKNGDRKFNKKHGNDTARPETPKQKATKLALKYGFVTPFTSLVVVKPNVTEDAATEQASKSQSSSKSKHKISHHASFIPSPVFQPNAGFPIALSQPSQNHRPSGGLSMGTRSRPQMAWRSTTRAPWPMSTRKVVYKVKHTSSPHAGAQDLYDIQRRPARPTHGLIHSTSITTLDEVDSTQQEGELSALVVDYEEIQPTTTMPTPPIPSIDDISWIRSSVSVNGTSYLIADQHSSRVNNGTAYECQSKMGSGTCVHLRHCIETAASISEEEYKASFFCPVQGAKPWMRYAGICCPGSTTDDPWITTTIPTIN